MAELKIKTNGRQRPLICWHDLTAKEQESYYWVSSTNQPCFQFFRYKRDCYCVESFLHTRDTAFEELRWDGFSPDSFFSGTLIKLLGNEAVIVGSYYS